VTAFLAVEAAWFEHAAFKFSRGAGCPQCASDAGDEAEAVDNELQDFPPAHGSTG
jgi:hypothetical protein